MKPSDNAIEMLAAGFAIQHKSGLIRFAHALLDKYAPQASGEYDREALAHKVNLLTAELLGHRSAAGHLSALVDELRGHLFDARQAMADFQQAFVPAFDTPETLTMVPNEALAPFCAALDRLCELDLPQADKDGGQQHAEEAPSDDALAQIGYAAAIAEVGWGETWADLEPDGDTQQEWRAGAKAIRAALSATQGATDAN